jgi:tetratricopeptide (TPR) repeat protein
MQPYCDAIFPVIAIARRSARPFISLIVLCLGLSILSACRTQTSTDCLSGRTAPLDLKLNVPIQRNLHGGETQCYQVSLAPEQYLHLTVNQIGIDVVITAFDPNSKQIARIDRPNGSRGREGLSILATQNGNYRLQIRSLEPAVNQAQYSIAVDEVRPVAAGDKDRALAEQSVSKAEEFRSSGVAANLPLAIDSFKSSVKAWRDLKDRYEECDALYGLALAHRTANENQDAITIFQDAQVIAHELGDVYMEGICFTGAGWALVYVGDTHEALNKFSTASALFHSINDRRGEGISFYGIGWVHALDGQYEQALEDFNQSLLIRRETKDRRGQALTLTGIGKILNRKDRNDEALRALNEALELLKDSKGEARADVMSALGWVYNSTNQVASARNCFAQALQIWWTIGNRTGEATTLYGLARAEAMSGDLPTAQQAMSQALDIVETMRSGGANERLRTSYFALVQDYFEFDIDLLMRLDRLYPQQNYASAAFEVSERSRNRKLLDLLNEAQVDIRLGGRSGTA